MVEDMLESLYEYKTQMDYQNADFNADKAKQYEAVRKILARKYVEDNSLFGPLEIEPIGEDENREAYIKRCESDKARGGSRRVPPMRVHQSNQFENDEVTLLANKRNLHESFEYSIPYLVQHIKLQIYSV